MNKQRRKEINEQWAKLDELKGKFEALKAEADEIKAEIERIRDEEQDAFDNMPESLQNGERGQASSEAIECLNNAMTEIEQIVDCEPDLDEALTQLDNAGA